MIKEICKLALSKVYFPVQSRITKEKARLILNTNNPKPEGICYTNNSISLDYDLQIIIPAYNAEKYLKTCLDSVFSQKSRYSTLVTIVNDGSTDSTGTILNSIPLKIPHTKIEINVINQLNKGYSGARNAALKNIRGNYVTFLDSDDILAPNAIETMLNVAYENNIDILQGSWYSFSVDKRKDCVLENTVSDSKGCAYISGYPWGKIFKYSVLKNFHFPEGFWFEDTPISFMIAALPVRRATIKNIVYGYRLNPDGITAKAAFSKKSIDSYWITEQCLQEFPVFNLQYDQRAYEYLLKQTLMNAGRICNQPKQIRECVFVLTSYLKNEYFSGLKTQNPKMKKIEKALDNRRFIQFELLKLHL